MAWNKPSSITLYYLLIHILALIPVHHSKGLADNLQAALLLLGSSCTSEDSSSSAFFWISSALPWSCEQYLVCSGGYSIVRQCPPGMVFRGTSDQFSSSGFGCDWPTSHDVRRCYKNMEGYARASCERHPSLVLPNPDSCALFIDCRQTAALWTAEQEADVTQGHVLECPYPDLFSPLTHRCSDFRQVQHLCHERPVPKAPCDYLQYRQLASSLNMCQRRHPSCMGMGDGFHPVSLTLPFRLYVKRCFQERTVDVISCTGFTLSPFFSNGNTTCRGHVIDV